MPVNAFTQASWAFTERADEKARQGLKWRGPNRTPRETLLGERKTTTARVRVRNTTPATVVLARAIEGKLINSQVSVVVEPKPRPFVKPVPPPVVVEAASSVPGVPRFYRWHSGARSEGECTPVW
jgi:hypothetical protein